MIIPEEIMKNIIVQKCVKAINIIIRKQLYKNIVTPEKFVQEYMYPDLR